MFNVDIENVNDLTEWNSYAKKNKDSSADLKGDLTQNAIIDNANQRNKITAKEPWNDCSAYHVTGGTLKSDVTDIEYNIKLRNNINGIKQLKTNNIDMNGDKIIDIVNITPKCGDLDAKIENSEELRKSIDSLEPYLKESGMPVFNTFGANKQDKVYGEYQIISSDELVTINTNAVLSLYGKISDDAIKNMPELQSDDGSIKIPKGVFSPEKMNNYLDQLIPEIKDINDYKLFIINECANAIAAGNKNKLSECIKVLQDMQKNAVPDNINMFNQLGSFIEQANKVTKSKNDSYQISKAINFDEENATLLIDKFNKTKTLADQVVVLAKLIETNNNLINDDNQSLVIHDIINKGITKDKNTMPALLIALGYQNIAKYDHETKQFIDIDYDKVELLKKSVPYFYQQNKIQD